MIRLALPLLALAASGCAHGEAKPAMATGVQCNAERLGGLTGRPRGAEVEAEALRLSGAKHARWLEPGAIVTMDFRADRLNLHLDDKGRIARATCG